TSRTIFAQIGSSVLRISFFLTTISCMFYLWFDSVLLLELIIGQTSPAKKDWLTERLEYLSGLMDHPLVTSGDCENITAVLHAYKEGTLQRPTPGKVVIFFGGIRRTSEVVF